MRDYEHGDTHIRPVSDVKTLFQPKGIVGFGLLYTLWLENGLAGKGRKEDLSSFLRGGLSTEVD